MSPQGVGVSLERHDAVAEGRAKGGGTTYYSIPGVVMSSVGTATFAVNLDRYAGWVARTPIVIDQLASEVTTLGASANFRIGFYRADRDWQPIGAPLADSGNLDGSSTGVKTYTPSTPIMVRPGRYLSAIIVQTTSITVRIVFGSAASPLQDSLSSSPFMVQPAVSRAYAAFPTPGTAWDTDTAGSSGGWRHFIFYRIVRP